MKQIPCEVIEDLIPLVIDGAASEPSKALVCEHIKTCDSCREKMGTLPIEVLPVGTKQTVLKRTRRALFWGGVLLLLCGALLAASVINTFSMFYNLIGLPILGAFGYFLFRKWSFAVPIGVFFITCLWQLPQTLAPFFSGGVTSAPWWSFFLASGMMALLYVVFTGIGVLIGWLLHIAFRKEREEHDEEKTCN